MDTTNTALLSTNVVLSGTNWNYTATVKSTAGSQAVVGGSFTSVGGTLQNRIARLNVDGSLDTAFIGGSGRTSPFARWRRGPMGAWLWVANFRRCPA